MKVFLYMRVSSEEQVKHGYSLDAQYEALKEFCKKNNHAVIGVYKDEGISARKPYTKRPAMAQLLQDIEYKKPDIILFTKLDRWFRNIKEYYKVQDILDKNKVDWKAINEEYDTSTASGRLYVNIKLSIAQDEADRTSERIKDIQSQLVMQGKVLTGRVPLGYEIKDKKVVFGDKINITKDIIDHYSLHQSMHGTARYANDKYDLNYTSRQIRRLLRSTLLKGEYRNNKNYCPALITPDKWQSIQDIMAKNVKHASKKRVFIFSGLLICPVCGTRMSGSFDGHRKYYRCVGRYDNRCTSKHNVNEEKLEKWLLDNIEADFKMQVKMRPKQKTESPKKYQDQLKRLNDIYMLGNITHQDYIAKTKELQEKIASLQKPAPKATTFTKDWQEVYAMLDDTHKRSFWRNIINQVLFDDEMHPIKILY